MKTKNHLTTPQGSHFGTPHRTLLSVLSVPVGLLLCLSSAPATAGTFWSDFNSDLPPNVTLHGSAFVDSSGGVDNSGALRLTQAYYYDQAGSIIIGSLDGGAPVTGFTATFKLLIGNGEGADGFSFNFANDLPDDVIGEEGAGTGLTVSFDTFDNGGGEAPAIDVKYRGFTVASTKGIGALFRTGEFVDVRIHLDAAGWLDLQLGTALIYDHLLVGFTPSLGRFGLGARTGGSTDDHVIDDLTIETTGSLPAGPYVLSVSPLSVATRGDQAITFVVKDGAVTKLDPATVLLLWNGTRVSPGLSRSGDVTTIQYDPAGLLAPGSANNLGLSFADTGVPPSTSAYTSSFVVANYVGPNGNFYEFIYAPGMSWPDARQAAEQRTFCGRPGHLATITDADEDLYLENLRQQSFWGEAWAGGFQLPDQLATTDGWFWVHDEGPIPGGNSAALYADWFPGEPNDWGATSDVEDNEENFLAIGQLGLGWNDQRAWEVNGYVVEYEAPIILIDVKPGDSANVINPESNGKIAVAILSTAAFDAASVDPATVRFGHAGTEAAPLSFTMSDVDGDRRKDLVCQFNTHDTGLLVGDSFGRLQVTPSGGCPIRGADAIVTDRFVQAGSKNFKISTLPYTITEPGNYTVTQDLACSGSAIIVKASKVDLSLGGHTLSGDGTGFGVLVEGQDVRIHQGFVEGFFDGVALGGVVNSTLDRLTVTHSTELGIAGRGEVTGLTVTGNTANYNRALGILLDSSSSGNTLTRNVANHNGGVGIGVGDGTSANSVTDNVANQNGGAGIGLGGTSANIVMRNNANNNGDRGIDIQFAVGNTVAVNTTDRNPTGIHISGDSHGNVIERNSATANVSEGIRLLDGPTENFVQDNTITGSNTGIWLGLGAGASRNTIRGNTITLSVLGIWLEEGSIGNTIQDNTLLDNLAFDLGDLNPGCDSNIWSGNHFTTDNEPGSGAGPGAGCIQ